MQTILDTLKTIGLVLLLGASFGIGVPVLYSYGLKFKYQSHKKAYSRKQKKLFRLAYYTIIVLIAIIIFIGILFVTKESLRYHFNIDIF